MITSSPVFRWGYSICYLYYSLKIEISNWGVYLVIHPLIGVLSYLSSQFYNLKSHLIQMSLRSLVWYLPFKSDWIIYSLLTLNVLYILFLNSILHFFQELWSLALFCQSGLSLAWLRTVVKFFMCPQKFLLLILNFQG